MVIKEIYFAQLAKWTEAGLKAEIAFITNWLWLEKAGGRIVNPKKSSPLISTEPRFLDPWGAIGLRETPARHSSANGRILCKPRHDKPEKNPATLDVLLSDPLLTDTDVARLTGRARKTLQKDRLRGGDVLIPFIRLGRLVRYRLSDVQRFIAQRPALRSTSDVGFA